MKKKLALILAAVLVLTLAFACLTACKENPPDTTTPDDNGDTPSTPDNGDSSGENPADDPNGNGSDPQNPSDGTENGNGGAGTGSENGSGENGTGTGSENGSGESGAGSENGSESGSGSNGQTGGNGSGTENGDNGGTGNNGSENGSGNGSGNNTPVTPPQPPQSTTVAVYYSNSKYWDKVYAYMWNSATQAESANWPGTELTALPQLNELNQRQYKVEVDYTKYDRIIFNNGSDDQTNDLVVSAATSGYYDTFGTFTMGQSANHGHVETKTLTDSKNLSYRGGSKKIYIYTPADYDPSKKYGVLYMFDGQNLFEKAASHSSGTSWAVDVAVTNLIQNGREGIIIVAIDNNDKYRDQELTMQPSFGTFTGLAAPNYGDFYNGKLDDLGNFLKETVMPYVKSRYSVDDSVAKTGIAGSSSGGIAAYYLGLRDSNLYGYIGAFSPANGLFDNASWERFYSKQNFTSRPKIYLYCGNGDDLENMLIPYVKAAKPALTQRYGFSASQITEWYYDSGTHNEAYWCVAFMEFLSLMVG